MKLTESMLRKMVKEQIKNALLESPNDQYAEKKVLIEGGLGMKELIAEASEIFPQIIKLARKADPTFLNKFKKSLAQYHDDGDYGSVHPEHIAYAIEEALGGEGGGY